MVIGLTGCAAGSKLTFGPATVSSQVSAHEWQDASFENDEEAGCVRSTLGFISSELCGQLHDCNGVGFGAYINWDQDGPQCGDGGTYGCCDQTEDPAQTG